MNKFLNIIVIFVITFMVLFFIIDKKVFSENENRNLFAFPTLTLDNFLSGEFTTKIDNYINDHFPLRDEFLILKTKVEVFLGKTLINDVYITDDYLFLKYEKNDELENIVNVLNDFSKNNENVEMDLLLVPSSSYINSDKLPHFIDSESEEEDMSYVSNNLLFNSINVVDNLMMYNERYDVYFKSDHHYSLYGAFAVYKSFCEEKGILFNDELEFSKASDDFYGTLSSKVSKFDGFNDEIYYYETNSVTVKYNNSSKLENSMYDFSYLSEKDKYSFFFGGNHSLIEISTSTENNKSILIVKDSYANSFIPFLTNDYETIYVIDLRFYNLSVSDFLESNDISEVLFLYSTSGLSSASSLNLLR